MKLAPSPLRNGSAGEVQMVHLGFVFRCTVRRRCSLPFDPSSCSVHRDTTLPEDGLVESFDNSFMYALCCGLRNKPSMRSYHLCVDKQNEFVTMRTMPISFQERESAEKKIKTTLKDVLQDVSGKLGECSVLCDPFKSVIEGIPRDDGLFVQGVAYNTSIQLHSTICDACAQSLKRSSMSLAKKLKLFDESLSPYIGTGGDGGDDSVATKLTQWRGSDNEDEMTGAYKNENSLANGKDEANDNGDEELSSIRIRALEMDIAGLDISNEVESSPIPSIPSTETITEWYEDLRNYHDESVRILCFVSEEGKKLINTPTPHSRLWATLPQQHRVELDQRHVALDSTVVKFPEMDKLQKKHKQVKSFGFRKNPGVQHRQQRRRILLCLEMMRLIARRRRLLLVALAKMCTFAEMCLGDEVQLPVLVQYPGTKGAEADFLDVGEDGDVGLRSDIVVACAPFQRLMDGINAQSRTGGRGSKAPVRVMVSVMLPCRFTEEVLVHIKEEMKESHLADLLSCEQPAIHGPRRKHGWGGRGRARDVRGRDARVDIKSQDIGCSDENDAVICSLFYATHGQKYYRDQLENLKAFLGAGPMQEEMTHRFARGRDRGAGRGNKVPDSAGSSGGRESMMNHFAFLMLYTGQLYQRHDRGRGR